MMEPKPSIWRFIHTYIRLSFAPKTGLNFLLDRYNEYIAINKRLAGHVKHFRNLVKRRLERGRK